MNAVALIPARAGSKRIPNKNIRPLNGVPLLAYTIRAALESGVFGDVVVSTDSRGEYANIALRYGATVVIRPPDMATDTSPDIEWVTNALSRLPRHDVFSILRPTSPFRTADTIRRAWAEFESDPMCDSLRAVEKVRQHPGKMWRVFNELRLWPLANDLGYWNGDGTPVHSMPTQSLPVVYVQNASLEIAHTHVVLDSNPTISGTKVRPFFTQGYEGFDLNDENDWLLAEALLARGLVTLPVIEGV